MWHFVPLALMILRHTWQFFLNRIKSKVSSVAYQMYDKYVLNDFLWSTFVVIILIYLCLCGNNCWLLLLTSHQSNFEKSTLLSHNYATVLISYNGTPQIHPQKLPLLLQWSPPIPWPSPLTIPNGIRIQSAILPQYTFRTDRPTDGLGDRPITWALCSLCW